MQQNKWWMETTTVNVFSQLLSSTLQVIRVSHPISLPLLVHSGFWGAVLPIISSVKSQLYCFLIAVVSQLACWETGFQCRWVQVCVFHNVFFSCTPLSPTSSSQHPNKCRLFIHLQECVNKDEPYYEWASEPLDLIYKCRHYGPLTYMWPMIWTHKTYRRDYFIALLALFVVLNRQQVVCLSVYFIVMHGWCAANNNFYKRVKFTTPYFKLQINIIYHRKTHQQLQKKKQRREICVFSMRICLKINLTIQLKVKYTNQIWH